MRGDYFKASCDLPQSSLWAEDAETCKLWITILAMKDRNHIVTKNIVGLSNSSRIPIERCKEIIQKFLSPDPYSTTPDHEGRRLQEVEGGYLVLNGEKYREMGWSEDKKAYERDRKQKYRNGQKAGAPKTPKEPPSKFQPPTIDAIRLQGAKIGLPQIEADKFHAYYESKGWKVGKSPMKNWHQAMAGWKLRNDEKTQTRPPGGNF